MRTGLQPWHSPCLYCIRTNAPCIHASLATAPCAIAPSCHHAPRDKRPAHPGCRLSASWVLTLKANRTPHQISSRCMTCMECMHASYLPGPNTYGPNTNACMPPICGPNTSPVAATAPRLIGSAGWATPKPCTTPNPDETAQP